MLIPNYAKATGLLDLDEGSIFINAWAVQFTVCATLWLTWFVLMFNLLERVLKATLLTSLLTGGKSSYFLPYFRISLLVLILHLHLPSYFIH